MADEELHETDSNNQKDWQSETSSSTVADETASKDTEQNAENASAEEGAAYGVNMEQVQAVLNATADKATLTPQMQRRTPSALKKPLRAPSRTRVGSCRCSARL